MNVTAYLAVFMNSVDPLASACTAAWTRPACHINLDIKWEGKDILLVLSSSKDNKGQSDLVGQLLLILAMGTSPHLGCMVCFPEESSPTSEDFYTSLKVMHD